MFNVNVKNTNETSSFTNYTRKHEENLRVQKRNLEHAIVETHPDVNSTCEDSVMAVFSTSNLYSRVS